MDTNELIETLAADLRRAAPSLDSAWRGAIVLAVAVAAAVFFATLGPRPDFAAAAETPRFLFKFMVTIALAVSAFGLARALSRPGEDWRKRLPWLAAAPALIAVAVVLELLVLPPDLWAARLIGTNSVVCLTYIPLIGIGPSLFSFWPCATARRPARPAPARSPDFSQAASRPPSMPPSARMIPPFSSPPGTRSPLRDLLSSGRYLVTGLCAGSEVAGDPQNRQDSEGLLGRKGIPYSASARSG